MKAKDVRFKIKIHNPETQLGTNFFSFKKETVFKENCFYLKLFLSKIIFSFKIDSITLDPDPN